jgi:hypothetical protein
MKFFHGKKGQCHFATEKRALAKTWGAAPPPVATPLVANIIKVFDHKDINSLPFSYRGYAQILGIYPTHACVHIN